MQIGQSLSRWITTLAALVAEGRLAWQARKSIVVTRQGGCFVLRRSGSKQEAVLAELPVGTQLPRETAEALRNQFILFEIDTDNIVTRRISVPLQAQEFLPGIVRNQIERLSPWPVAQAVYGFDAKPDPGEQRTLDVRVLIAARARINTISEELQSSGLSVDQIVAIQETNRKASPIVLWTRSTRESMSGFERLPRVIGISLAGLVLASLTLSGWALSTENSAWQDYDEMTMRVVALQQRDRPAHQPAAMTSRDPAERAWTLRENSPTAVLTLEALARALPDTAYLTELSLENASLRIIGLAVDAPSLIGSLERSRHFSSVHFFAPTTRDADSGRYRFYIEARVDNHFVPIGN